MPRISWVEEQDATGRLAELFEDARSGSISGIKRPFVADILHTMSHRPDFLAAIMEASRMHFSDGALDAGPARDDCVVRLGVEPLSLLTEQPCLVPAVAGRAVR